MGELANDLEHLAACLDDPGLHLGEARDVLSERLRGYAKRIRSEVANADEYTKTAVDPWVQNVWGAISACLSRIGAK